MLHQKCLSSEPIHSIPRKIDQDTLKYSEYSNSSRNDEKSTRNVQVFLTTEIFP